MLQARPSSPSRNGWTDHHDASGYGLYRYLNTQRTVQVGTGQHTVKVELSAQTDNTFAAEPGGATDVSYLQVEVQ